MKKLWSCLCFLVLALSSVSKGQDETTAVVYTDLITFTTSTPSLSSLDRSEINDTFLASFPFSQNSTSAKATDPPTTVFTGQEETSDKSDHDSGHSAAPQTTSSSSEATTGVDDDIETIETSSESLKPVQMQSSQMFWGYAILASIILVIIILCIILYLLRRVSRTYSFDLQRPSPANHRNEPIGTFEPVHLDDLDRPAPEDQVTNDDLSPPPVTNGTTVPSEEKGSSGENALQEQPDANGLETSSIGNKSPSADNTSDQLPSTTIFFGEDQLNENNNNPSVCFSDPFVEINLDEPAWCDQLLTSSSVLPFSPFSPFSSSSSSSSSSS